MDFSLKEEDVLWRQENIIFLSENILIRGGVTTSAGWLSQKMGLLL
tara:strand:- start:345 stop:482 length:138 start_codon:yes stop_codon:yes gene_type:complete